MSHCSLRVVSDRIGTIFNDCGVELAKNRGTSLVQVTLEHRPDDSLGILQQQRNTTEGHEHQERSQLKGAEKVIENDENESSCSREGVCIDCVGFSDSQSNGIVLAG